MGWFKDLRIRAKLLLGFGVMCGMIVSLAFLSYRAMENIETIERVDVDGSHMAAAALIEMRSDENRIRADMLGFVAFQDSAQQSAFLQDVEVLSDRTRSASRVSGPSSPPMSFRKNSPWSPPWKEDR